MYYTNVSLRLDERDAIQRFMKEHNLKFHQVMKLAIRRFLFPEEHIIPLNGKEVHIEETAQPQDHETPQIIKLEGFPL